MTPEPKTMTKINECTSRECADHSGHRRRVPGALAARIVLLLVAVTGILRAAVTPSPPEAFMESSRTIVEHIFTDDTHAVADAVLTEMWYHPRQRNGIAGQVRDMIAENRVAVEGAYGRITNRAILVGSLQVGRQTEMIYLVTGEFADLPVKIVYIQRDDGLFISGFFFGNSVKDSITRLSTAIPAAASEQLEH